jgi:hypothetical protein
VKRDELLDNLVASYARDELVTLTLQPVTGGLEDVEMSGRILVLAEHYSSRSTLQVVFKPSKVGDTVKVIGLSMIKRFRVGR